MREEQARAIVSSTESRIQALTKNLPEQEANLAEIRRIENTQRRDRHSEELREMRESQETMVSNLRARREELKRLLVEQQAELSAVAEGNAQIAKKEEEAARAAANAASAKEKSRTG